MTTVAVRNANKEEKKLIAEIAELHVATFEGFFLTFLGKGFLRSMYQSFCEHGPSGVLVAEDEAGKLFGFLAYSGDMSGLYRYMIKKRLPAFAWYSAGAFFRRPKVFLRLIRALLKPGESRREERYVELASIGVSPDAKSGGVGSRLIDALKERVDFSEFAYITLETDAEDNEAANAFYRKNGFSLVRDFETHEGRKMNEYRYRGESA